MAVFRRRNDGQPYIVRGYPIVGTDGLEDMRFSSYNLQPPAEKLFDESHFREGEVIHQHLFYLLFVERDITNRTVAGWPRITILNVPRTLRREEIEPYAQHPEFREFSRTWGLDPRQSYLEVFRTLVKRGNPEGRALQMMSFFCLARR